MNRKISLLIPEAPTPEFKGDAATARLNHFAVRLGILDNGKGNADHLLRFLVQGLKAVVPVTFVVSLRKASASLRATNETLEQLASECNFVVTAMAD